MNNIYNGHEFIARLGIELKPEESGYSYLECIACGHTVTLSIFYASDETIKRAFSNPCILKRK